jgi:putative endonuclease
MAAINDAQTRQELGRLGEELAVDYFRQRGMLVLDRNWRPQRANLRGELDLVVRDEDTLVIVEVKTRRCLAFGSPAESVTRRKLRALHSLALAWLDQRQVHAPRMRFDVISITVPPAGQPVLEHLRGV